ncbi:MAG: SAM-dependent methyltransferase [Bacilli bacterium]|nr:SAM-dependent methyltransferase [Bacilli bacterium]
MKKNMTALVSCFSRAYHYQNNSYKIYSDNYATRILTEEEYNMIGQNMAKGINFFNSNFKGTEEEALRWIVDNQLSPLVLARSAFTEKMLKNAIKLGCTQYLIYASGYDMSAYKLSRTNLSIFEIDKKEIINDKKKRLAYNNIDISNISFIKTDFTNSNWIDDILKSSYDNEKISFSSLLGISYYLTKEKFENLIQNISENVFNGSSIVFDYPTFENEIESNKTELLALEAGEKMQAKYSYNEVEKILSKYGFLIYEHLNSQEMTKNYFEVYNMLNPKHKMKSPPGVSYCLAVRKIVK